MRRADFLHAFALLGERFEQPVRLVLAGGSAMILLGYLDRDTGDLDAIDASPRLWALRHEIAAVAEEIGVAADWLNDGVTAYRDLLPAGFHARLQRVGTFGRLTVDALGRQDLILLKMAAARPRDLDDLRALAPTPDDVVFVERELERVSRVAPHLALRIDLYLRQRESPHDREDL